LTLFGNGYTKRLLYKKTLTCHPTKETMKTTLIEFALGGLLGAVIVAVVMGVNYLTTGYVI